MTNLTNLRVLFTSTLVDRRLLTGQPVGCNRKQRLKTNLTCSSELFIQPRTIFLTRSPLQSWPLIFFAEKPNWLGLWRNNLDMWSYEFFTKSWRHWSIRFNPLVVYPNGDLEERKSTKGENISSQSEMWLHSSTTVTISMKIRNLIPNLA